MEQRTYFAWWLQFTQLPVVGVLVRAKGSGGVEAYKCVVFLRVDGYPLTTVYLNNVVSQLQLSGRH